MSVAGYVVGFWEWVGEPSSAELAEFYSLQDQDTVPGCVRRAYQPICISHREMLGNFFGWISLCMGFVLCAVAMTWRKAYMSVRGSHTHCECTRQPPEEGEEWNANPLGCGSAKPPAKTFAVEEKKLFALQLFTSRYKFKIEPTYDVFLVIDLLDDWWFCAGHQLLLCQRGLHLLIVEWDKKGITF